MRGDSLRDFYAKTLAVLGLGVLAGAGAIVDYWPVSDDVPDVPAVVGLRVEAPVLVQDLNREIPAPPRPAHRPLPAAMTVATTTFNGLAPSAAGTGVALDPMPAPEDFVRIESDLPSLLLTETIEILAAPMAGPGSDDSRRFFSDAARRTRESLAAARVFLNGAFSGLAGAFRRVSPFFVTGVAGPVSH